MIRYILLFFFGIFQSIISLASDDNTLLNGRLNCSLPKGTVLFENKPTNLMGVASSKDIRQSFTVNVGSSKLEISVKELLCYESQNMDSSIIELASSWESEKTKYSSEILLINNLKIYKISPNEFRVVNDRLFLSQYYIINKDKTIQELAVYGNKESLNNLDTCQSIINNFIKSLEAGERKLVKSGRVDTLSTRFGQYKLELLEDYVMVYQKGIDFDVYKIYKLNSFDSPESKIVFYLGNHPNLVIDDDAKNYGDVFRKKAKFLGLKTKVTIFVSWDGSKIIQEYLVNPNESKEYLQSHLCLSTFDIPDLQELVFITKSMEYIK